MRKIYESDALHRDDNDPTSPDKRNRETKLQSFRSLPSTTISNTVTPHTIRKKAISLKIATNKEEYKQGTKIPFRVEMKNVLPIPVTLKTTSNLPWNWAINGATEAIQMDQNRPADQEGTFEFDRGERKKFTKSWDQMFQITEREWEEAPPGTYTISAAINVENPEQDGLYVETEVTIV